MPQSQQSNQTGGSQMPLDNLSYDLITLIYEKSKGLEAYEKYMRDAQGDDQVASLLEELRTRDAESVTRLKTELQRVLGQGNSEQGATNGS